MVLNPKNVTITQRARMVLDKNIPPGPLSKIKEMRLVAILYYCYGTQFTNQGGQTIRDENANYLIGRIQPAKLKNEILLELADDKFIAVNFELPFSEEKLYTIDFDGEHIIIY